MRECLAGHQFVNQWNEEALKRLQMLLNEAQRAQGIERQKVRTLLGWIRPEKEVLPSQEEINVALQQQQLIDHAVTTCEQALALAELLQSIHVRDRVRAYYQRNKFSVTFSSSR